jgi:sulfate adenylyltransferase
MTASNGRNGVCVWLTGLSGSGKTTTANALERRLSAGPVKVTLLDGDAMRAGASRGLGFSRADRDENVRRVGAAARQIVGEGGIAICAIISPYRATRREIRDLVGPGTFIEVFVATPLDVCESRDPKGLYARARRGEIQGFTGVDDPYEEPLDPDVVLDAVGRTPEENAELLLTVIRTRGHAATP